MISMPIRFDMRIEILTIDTTSGGVKCKLGVTCIHYAIRAYFIFISDHTIFSKVWVITIFYLYAALPDNPS